MRTALKIAPSSHNQDATVPLLELRGISKEFPGVKALDDVSFAVFPGEVHMLLGENGAGVGRIGLQVRFRCLARMARANRA